MAKHGRAARREKKPKQARGPVIRVSPNELAAMERLTTEAIERPKPPTDALRDAMRRFRLSHRTGTQTTRARTDGHELQPEERDDHRGR